jgi:hypothetical protein
MFFFNEICISLQVANIYNSNFFYRWWRFGLYLCCSRAIFCNSLSFENSVGKFRKTTFHSPLKLVISCYSCLSHNCKLVPACNYETNDNSKELPTSMARGTLLLKTFQHQTCGTSKYISYSTNIIQTFIFCQFFFEL